MQLVSGRDFFNKKAKMFDEVVGFAKFSEYLIVAEVRCLFSLELSGADERFARSISPCNAHLTCRSPWTAIPLPPVNSLLQCGQNNMWVY
jgi:hypothetical protein